MGTRRVAVARPAEEALLASHQVHLAGQPLEVFADLRIALLFSQTMGERGQPGPPEAHVAERFVDDPAIHVSGPDEPANPLPEVADGARRCILGNVIAVGSASMAMSTARRARASRSPSQSRSSAAA